MSTCFKSIWRYRAKNHYFTSLAKRATKLGIDIDVTKYTGKIDLVVDSTGLKVYGEGEWKVKKHGWAKHRTWRKPHLMIDPATHQIVAELLTGNDVHDSQVVKTMLDETENEIGRFHGDGAYDPWDVRDELEKRGIEQVIPPREDAVLQNRKDGRRRERDQAIREIGKRGRKEWKKRTGYCPDDLTIRELDREAVESFGEYLLSEFAEKTVHERFKSLRRSFRYAQKKGAIYYNPFNDVRAGSDRGTPSEYVPVDVAEKVLPYCLDDETRLALVFGRFAGVRMPSEIRDLKWSDIETDRFHVRKGKTGARVVPLFPRVSEEMMKQKRDSEWVFPIEHASNYCRAYWNIRRAVERSGATPWPKLLNSLRASCITEYAHENFHEVTLNAVFGNSESVRKKHYVKVREKEYADMIRAGRLMHEKQPGRKNIDAIIKLMPLLSKEEVLNLWENAQKGL